VVWFIDHTTNIITTIAGTGTAGYCCDGEPATTAQLVPLDVCLDSFGNLYIADYANERIRKINGTTGVPKITNVDFEISPNPATTVIHIGGISDSVVYRIINMVGISISSGTLLCSDGNISVQDYPPGIYFLELIDQDTGSRVVKKVVKE
jgi:hypothetical protein